MLLGYEKLSIGVLGQAKPPPSLGRHCLAIPSIATPPSLSLWCKQTACFPIQSRVAGVKLQFSIALEGGRECSLGPKGRLYLIIASACQIAALCAFKTRNNCHFPPPTLLIKVTKCSAQGASTLAPGNGFLESSTLPRSDQRKFMSDWTTEICLSPDVQTRNG